MRVFTLMLLVILAAPARADGPGLYFIDTGPLRLRDTFILNSGFLVMEPDTPTPVTGGRSRLDVFHTKSNTFAKSRAVEDLLEARSSRAPLTLGQLGAINPAGGLLYLDVSATYLGEHPAYGVDSQTVVSAAVADEVGLSPRSSVVGQLTATQSPLRSLDIPELAETSTQVSLGYKRQVARKTALFAAFTENIAHFDNTADVGFHLGVSQNL